MFFIYTDHKHSPLNWDFILQRGTRRVYPWRQCRTEDKTYKDLKIGILRVIV